MARTLTLTFSLAVAWLLWSGLYKGLLLALGAASCLLVVYLARRMNLLDERIFTLDLLPRILGFWAWLFREVIRSNIEVARVILDPALRMQPQIIEIDAETQTQAGQAILGNCITLTPGTVTLDVYQGRLRVHALTDAGAAALRQGEINRRVRQVIGS
jgi:multicomponent Na+:H+ antiporter subunit E